MGGIGIKTVACGLTHSGCVLEDGSVYIWGMSGDMLTLKEQSERILLKKPTRINFKSNDQVNNGNLS